MFSLWISIEEILIISACCCCCYCCCLSAASPISSTQCLAGSKSTATTGTFPTGVFLDVRNPAPCSGTLVAWNYCFYPTSFSTQRTVSVTVGVWQFSKEFGRHVAVESSLDVLSADLSRQNPNQRPFFLCGMKTVTSGIEIQQGSVVAVVANSSGSFRLPVLGMALDGTDYVLNLETSINVSLRMHVSAVIQDDAPFSTTSMTEVLSRGGVGGGVAVPVGVVVGVVVLLVATVMAVLLCLFWRSRQKERTATLKTYGMCRSVCV